jgi:hypothetical protein
MEKRGAVSLFIIVGLVILLTVGLIYYITKGVIPLPGQPNEIKDLKTFTDACIANSAENALSIIEVQGGYIELPQKIKKTPGSYIDMGFKIPYWYYNGEDRMPTKKMMEIELSNYMNKNLAVCLNNFSSFKGRYRVSAGNIATEATVYDKSVSFKVNYPLNVSVAGQDKVYYLSSFSNEVESKLGLLHRLAQAIMKKENQDAFLENYTDEMIACSDWLPYEGMEFSCGPKTWLVKDMKPYIQTMIMHNLHFLMFENTYYKETGMPYYDKQYKVNAASGSAYKKIQVSTIYNPDWPTELEVLPSKNGVVKANEFKIADYIGTCVKVYHHKYSLNYPVLFRLTDTENPEEVFYFATPVIMRRNLPDRHSEVPPWPEEIDTLGSSKFCANTTTETEYLTDSSGKFYTRQTERDNKPYQLNIYAVNTLLGSSPQASLPGVKISYQCVQFMCSIGTTAYHLSNGLLESSLASLYGKFPACSGGLIIAEKPGYLKAIQQVSADTENNNSQVTVQMVPLKQFDYAIRVMEDKNGVVTKRALAEGESAIITLKNIDAGYEQTIVYPTDDEYYTNLTIPIAELTYSLDIKLIKDDLYLGGLELNWTPQLRELMAARHVMFFAVKKETLLSSPTAEEAASLIEYTQKNSAAYPPRLE